MGLILKKYVSNRCLLGLWEITESFDELYSKLNLTRKEQDLVISFKSNNRKVEWLSVRVLLKELIGDKYAIVYGENRKPYISDDSYNISISHSYKITSILLSPDRHVGIDLENMSHDINKVASKFINSKEVISKRSPETEKYHLYIHWCAKETLYKICDKQEINFKENLYIHPFELNEKGILKGHVNNQYIDKEFELHYFRHENYIIVWCCN